MSMLLRFVLFAFTSLFAEGLTASLRPMAWAIPENFFAGHYVRFPTILDECFQFPPREGQAKPQNAAQVAEFHQGTSLES